PSLANGEAWVWSPQFLKKTEKFRFRLSDTYDSGETPKAGKARKQATLADVDIEAVKKKMADTIERAKKEDPAELRRTIQSLEAALRARPKEVERVEVPMISKEQVQLLRDVATEIREQSKPIFDMVANLEKAAVAIYESISAWKKQTTYGLLPDAKKYELNLKSHVRIPTLAEE